MAKTVESKKRKASVPESGAVKVQKVKQVVEATSAPAPVAAKKRKATETTIDVPEVKKSKKATKAAPVLEKLTSDVVTSKKLAKKIGETSKPAKVTKKVFEEPEEKEPQLAEENGATDTDNEGSASEIDDQTEALLKGFESDGDDKDSDGEGLEEGAPVPEVKLTKGQKKAIKKAQEEADGDKPGVLFISRIPHGFFEHQMKEYFGQFGTILQLRLSRNKATGASKHFAFIQFESTTVAEIVAKTMDNYLLFGHILKVKVVPDEAVPVNVWKGAGKRFKNIPRNKIAGRKLKLPATEEIWDKRAEKVQEKREVKAAKLKEMGYEMPLPKIKSAKGLAKEHVDAPATIQATEPVKVIEDVPATVLVTTTEPTKAKKNGKAAKSEPAPAETETPAVEIAKAKKAPKVKKTKETKSEEVVEEPVVEASAEEPAKSKKTKKTKVTSIETVEITPEIGGEPPEEESSKPKKKGKKAKAVEEAPVIEESPAEKPKKKGEKVTAVEEVTTIVQETPVPAIEDAEPKKKALKGKKTKSVVAAVEDVSEEKVEKVKKPKKGKNVAAA